MFKTIYAVIFAMALCGVLSAQTEEWSWVQTAGTSEDETIASLTMDDAGNSFVTGVFINTLTLGGTTLTSLGDSDIYIAKADPDGNWLWATRAGSVDAEIINAITVDSDNNVLITGCYYSSATFGSYTLNSVGDYDIFIAKLDNAGNWLWATSGGGAYFDEGRDIVTDPSGNVYVTGSVMVNGVFGTHLFTGYGGADILLAKANPSGVWQWCVNSGSDGADYGMGLFMSGSSDIYMTGSFAGVGNFGPTSIDSAGYHDVFVARFDTDGVFEWIRQAGGAYEDWGHHVAVDADGNVFVVGLYRMNANFGSLSLDALNGAYSEIFIAKISSAGAWSWVKQAGGYDVTIASDLSLQSQRNILLTGYFRSQARFGDVDYSSLGAIDAFLAEYTPAGVCVNAKTYGGAGQDRGIGLAVNAEDVYVCGSFSGEVSFGDYAVTSAGAGDIFLAKLVGFVPVIDDTDVPPPSLATLTNYPNPFTQNTCISLRMQNASVSGNLDIYDLRGQLVKRLHSGSFSQGIQEYRWDGKDSLGQLVPSGMYFTSLKVGSQRITRRMVLCK